MDLYSLRWDGDTQPKPAAVAAVLTAQGFTLDGAPKVYANGDILVHCLPSPEGKQFDWAVPPAPLEDRLAVHVKAILTAKALLERTPEHKRSPAEQGTLAIIALLLFGYGIEPD